jgi:hypothetical protein
VGLEEERGAMDSVKVGAVVVVVVGVVGTEAAVRGREGKGATSVGLETGNRKGRRRIWGRLVLWAASA